MPKPIQKAQTPPKATPKAAAKASGLGRTARPQPPAKAARAKSAGNKAPASRQGTGPSNLRQFPGNPRPPGSRGAAGRSQRTAPKGGQRRPPPRRRRRRRKPRSNAFYYTMLVLFCAAVMVVLCYTVFFKVEKIRVTGSKTYSQKEIIDIIGVKEGDSLFQVSTGSNEKRLEILLPYIQEAQIRRLLPATIEVKIKEEQPMGALYTPDGYAVVSTTGKILETQLMEAPKNLMKIFGLEDQLFEVNAYAKETGENIKPKEAKLLNRIVMLQDFYAAMQAKEVKNFDYVDLTDQYNIQALYDDRILISFGTQLDLDYKLDMLQDILEGNRKEYREQVTPSFQGSIDLSSTGKVRIRSMLVESLRNPLYLDDFVRDQQTEDTPSPGVPTPPQSGEEEQNAGEEPNIGEEPPVSQSAQSPPSSVPEQPTDSQETAGEQQPSSPEVGVLEQVEGQPPPNTISAQPQDGANSGE